MSLSVRELADYLSDVCEIRVLDPERMSETIDGPAPVGAARTGQVTFVRGNDTPAMQRLQRTLASIVIVQAPAPIHPPDASAAVLVYAANPRLQMIRVVDRFFSSDHVPGIDPSAHVSPEATLGKNVRVEPTATIGRASIGDNTRVCAGAHVLDGVTIGADCVLYPGAIVGADGFGYERNEDSVPQKFPHVGGVRVGNRVEIGANACVDRGTLGDTVIENDVKIDNLVHIAHNVRVGASTMIAACATIAGSTLMGARVWVGPNACVSDGLTVGDDAVVSLGAVVTQDVPQGQRVTGNFAVDHDRFIGNLRRDRK